MEHLHAQLQEYYGETWYTDLLTSMLHMQQYTLTGEIPDECKQCLEMWLMIVNQIKPQ